MKHLAIYIMANKKNGTIYTGVTSNLLERVYEHKSKMTDGFTKKYNCALLVYYEIYNTIESAITREKQIKASSRKKKLKLIEEVNPEWKDLYNDII